MDGWPIPKFPLRAGLLAVILCLLLVFASAAPLLVVPGQSSQLSYRPSAAASESVHGFFSSNPTRRNVEQSQHVLTQLVKAAHEDLETTTLFRRTSVLDKLKAWGRGVKAKFQNFAHKVKNTFTEVGKKIGHFFQDTGAKIAKVGLKVIGTVAKGISRVVGLVVPGIGKAIGKAIDGVGNLANMASNHIKAHLSPKLENAMSKMDKARKYMGYVP